MHEVCPDMNHPSGRPGAALVWRLVPMLLALLTLCGASVAQAQSRVPDRQIPPSVLSELRELENKFDLALAVDCDAERCFSKGCIYIDHSVADRPRAMSLPGLGQDPGPGSVASQEYLTAARCSYAHEESVETRDVAALSRRLQSKLSKGWTVVSVDGQRLQPLPPYLQEPPEPEPTEEPETEAEGVEPDPLTASTAASDLWTSLLPHFYWMIAVVLVSLAGVALIWAWRRVGRESVEEQMLLAELARGDGGADGEGTGAPQPDSGATDAEFVAAQDAAWMARLEATDADAPDVELQALIRERLRAGDLPLLAKAVLRFPERFPAAFPAGGEIASAKLELADFLKEVDMDALPSDADFFRSLNRCALSAAVAHQSDAQIVQSLRQEFGAGGLATLIAGLPPRPGGLLFSLAPGAEQLEMLRLLEPATVASMAEMLLRSNRMDVTETAYLFAVLSAARKGEPLPRAAEASAVTDRGPEFDAVGALSVLLESVNPARRTALFAASLKRFQGQLPSWHRGILVAEMLFELSRESRADLLLGIDAESLAAWLSVVGDDASRRLVSGLPDALRASVSSFSGFGTRDNQVRLASAARAQLAVSFQEQLSRANLTFERVVDKGLGDP